MIRRLAALLALCAGPAWAALPPCVYDQMISEAPLAFQMEVLSVVPPDGDGICRVTGEIQHSFRGTPDSGQIIVRVPCLNRQGLVGPTIWHDETALRAARFMEIYGAIGQGVAGYGAGAFIIEGLTQSPTWQPDPLCTGE